MSDLKQLATKLGEAAKASTAALMNHRESFKVFLPIGAK